MTLAFPIAAALIGADETKKPLFGTVDLDRGELDEPKRVGVCRLPTPSPRSS